MHAFRYIVALVTIMTLYACAMPAHNNTLIFSVKRKVGVGVNASSEGMPNVYLGYSASELAWVPLWANGKDGPMPCEAQAKSVDITSDTATGSASDPAKSFVANSTVESFRDVACMYGPKLLADGDGAFRRDVHDAFSTFSSFGGDLGATASVGNQSAEGRGKLASFFATGVAAQNLSKQVGLVSNVFSPNQEAGKPKLDNHFEQADAQAEKAGKFIALTIEPDAKKPAVRPACVTLLSIKALLSSEETKAMGALPTMTFGEWKTALSKSKELSASLAVIAHAGAFLEKDFTAKLEDKGRKELAAHYCPT